MSEEEDYKKAKTYAWKRLARKNQPAVELRKHLQDREYSESIIERVIQECQSAGYIDDQAWMDAFVRRETARNQSPRAIAFKLQQKGLSKEIIQEALNRLCGEDARAHSIRALISKKSKTVDLNDRKQKDKLVASLLRKGFNLSEIFAILRSEEKELS